MARMLDSLFDSLSKNWKAKHAPRSKRAYRCRCGRPVFFLNTQCLNCESQLGYEPTIGEVRALVPGASLETWRLAQSENLEEFRRCANFEPPAHCNWLLPADEQQTLCRACRLNQTIPDLTDPDNQRYWRSLEADKRRLVSQLIDLGLPVEPKSASDCGLAFDLVRASASGERVSTGHSDGLITINIEEADDAKRERIRTELNEPYRTLLGHFRHEVGHYYWDRLVRDTHWLARFRNLFGDERADYASALQANYQAGPPVDWADRHISAYASSHPWEDWAETWAHFLHILDSLDTAVAHGLDSADLDTVIEPFNREDLYDPDHPEAERTLFVVNSWIELITVLNELARSLGQPDFYPFVMPKAVVKKLQFIGLVVADASGVPAEPNRTGET